jgi:MerR family transcriptional regulator, thiopeptide resistance regulator
MRTVGEVSEMTGVTVRTLHHYDEIGLLAPSGRSEAGYRLYAYADLARLQEILIWRALGFPLGEIQSMLDDPAYDRIGALRRQRELVERAPGLAAYVRDAFAANAEAHRATGERAC